MFCAHVLVDEACRVLPPLGRGLVKSVPEVESEERKGRSYNVNIKTKYRNDNHRISFSSGMEWWILGPSPRTLTELISSFLISKHSI